MIRNLAGLRALLHRDQAGHGGGAARQGAPHRHALVQERRREGRPHTRRPQQRRRPHRAQGGREFNALCPVLVQFFLLKDLELELQ